MIFKQYITAIMRLRGQFYTNESFAVLSNWHVAGKLIELQLIHSWIDL